MDVCELFFIDWEQPYSRRLFNCIVRKSKRFEPESFGPRKPDLNKVRS